ncbi:hypothetical protein SUN_1330 [Sulfurovum sp. NBC37-1]|nr:hypothetical protein SUN_1330 [Sulfurovum sp. NBC37-1]
MKKILFVCLGNICRSPLAEGIAKKYAKEKGLYLHIDSAGTSDWHEGKAPCEHSVKIARDHSVDISGQRSRPLRSEDTETFDCASPWMNKTRRTLKISVFLLCSNWVILVLAMEWMFPIPISLTVLKGLKRYLI